MKQILEIAPKAIALLSFVVLSLTVIHEQGYFWVIGSHFQTVVSAYDYLSNAILWLPQNLLILLFAGVIAEITLLPVRRWRWLRRGDDYAGFRPRFVIWFVCVNLVLSVGTALPIYFFVRPNFILVYFFPILFGYAAILIFMVWLFQDRYEMGRNQLLALLVIPSIFVFDFLIGQQEAHVDIDRISDVYVLAFKDESQKGAALSAEVHVQVLRSFDKGLLIRDPQLEKNFFVRWDAIESIGHSSYRDGTLPRGCAKFPRICGMATEP